MAEENGNRRVSHAIEFIKTYWLIVVLAGGFIQMYFELQFVLQHVNPDSVVEHRLDKQKYEFRWCLTIAQSEREEQECAR